MPMNVFFNDNYESCRLDSISAYQERNNTVIINGIIDSEMAFEVISELDYFSRKDKNKEITVLINSQGGSLNNAFIIYDFVKSIPNKVKTVGIGTCASTAAFLLTCAGDKRNVYPNCQIIYNQQVSRVNEMIKTQNQYLKDLKNKVIEELSMNSSLSIEECSELINSESFLSIEECLKNKLIDGIIRI